MSTSKLLVIAASGLISIFTSIHVFAETKSVDRMIVIGDSLSDDGGENSTWYLLKALNGQEGEQGIEHIQPWVRAWLSERVAGYGWFCHWKYIPCRTVERAVLKTTIDLLSASGEVPVLPPSTYYKGHWSNGPIWAEYLAPMMGIPTGDKTRYINVSHGGSWSLCIVDKALGIKDLTGNLKTVAKDMIEGSLIPPCLKLLAKGIIYKYGSYHPNDLVILFSGANDYLSLFKDPSRIIQAQAEVIEEAIVNGAKDLAWLNVPDLAQTPRFINGSKMANAEEVTQLIQTHNRLLKQKYAELKSKYADQGVNLILVDTNSVFKNIINNAYQHGIYVIDQPCNTQSSPGVRSSFFQNNPSMQAINAMTALNGGICQNQSEYMFWDDVHPSTAMHKVIAHKACEVLQKQGYNCQM